jgi:hypothetical protein
MRAPITAIPVSYRQWSPAMPKENDLEGQQDQGGKHGGQKGMPKPEPKPGHYPPQKVKHDEDGKTDKSK